MKTVAWLFALATIALLTPAYAADNQPHDYQVTVVPHGPNSTYVEALIVDSRTGDLWDYINQSQVGSTPGGATIIYQGKLAPGTSPGQVIYRRGFGLAPVEPTVNQSR